MQLHQVVANAQKLGSTFGHNTLVQYGLQQRVHCAVNVRDDDDLTLLHRRLQYFSEAVAALTNGCHQRHRRRRGPTTTRRELAAAVRFQLRDGLRRDGWRQRNR